MGQPLYTIIDEGGSFTLFAMIEANRDMPAKDLGEMVKALVRLRVGHTVTFGGGATAETRIKRIK